jgi:hypothetical protein
MDGKGARESVVRVIWARGLRWIAATVAVTGTIDAGQAEYKSNAGHRLNPGDQIVTNKPCGIFKIEATRFEAFTVGHTIYVAHPRALSLVPLWASHPPRATLSFHDPT